MKLAIVTGGNKGIGFEICKKLGAAGVKTIVACRNEGFGQEAVANLKDLGYDVEYRHLDISDDWSIARFSRDISDEYGYLDILVNNAAIAFKASDPTPFKEQTRPTIETNFFGTMRITESLMPLLQKAEAPRIVNVASQAGHLRILKSEELKERFVNCPSIDALENLVNEYVAAVQDGTQTEKGWPDSNYGISKLAVISLTRILAKREAKLNPDKNFLINACCPGYCDTDMTSHKGPRPAEHGARTPTMLALLSEVGPVAPTGKFFYDEAEIEW